MTPAPTQSDASRWEEMARAINGQMDLWIQTEKQRGTWEANAPTVGQAYYASLVVAAFAQVAAESLEHAALIMETWHLNIENDNAFRASEIRRLKSPSHLLPKKSP